MLTKLALISKRARREPRFQFTSLAHLLDEGFLAACYYRLGRDRASGIDGVYVVACRIGLELRMFLFLDLVTLTNAFF